MARVSIVLPTYNGEQYLKEAINSIIGQSYVDWELIIVDDCSTDNTPTIAKEYCKQDLRIKYLKNNKNMKLPSSLNNGFNEAKGEYLTWTSDDNIYDSEAINEMVFFLDSHKSSYMVRANMMLVDADNNEIGVSEPFSSKKMAILNCVGACFLYRREIYDEIGGYDINLFCVEDYDYWLRIQERFGAIDSIDKILYRYRCHARSLSYQKKDMVCSQLSKMRMIHKAYIIEKLLNEKRDMYALYEIMRRMGEQTKDIPAQIYDEIPFLKYDSLVDNKLPCVVYGAGNYGTEAYCVLNGEVEYFIDSNKEIVGTEKLGKVIKGIDEGFYEIKKFNLIIAVSYDKLDGVFAALAIRKITKYTSLCYLIQQIMGAQD